MLNVRSTSGGPTRFAPGTLDRPHIGKSLLLGAALLFSMTPAQAEYLLHAGDTIEISVARLPELKQRVPVK